MYRPSDLGWSWKRRKSGNTPRPPPRLFLLISQLARHPTQSSTMKIYFKTKMNRTKLVSVSFILVTWNAFPFL